MEAKFTQGIWVTTKGWNNAESHIDCNDKTIIICRAFKAGISPEEAEANAKLLVQSPAMYEFLTTFIDMLKDKKKLTIWEKAILHSAKEIIEPIES